MNKLDYLRLKLAVWLLKPYFRVVNVYWKGDKVISITFDLPLSLVNWRYKDR